MNLSNEDFFSSTPPSATTPLAKDPSDRSHGDKLKMNSTPNGYNSIPNHKPRPEEQALHQKHHESSSKHSESSKHNSDHMKQKDPSKHLHSSSSSHGKPEGSSSHKSNDLSKHKEHSHDKEKKHSSSKHTNSEHSKHDGLKNGTEKIKSESDKIKKHKSSDGLHKHSSDGLHKHSSDVKKLDKSKEDKPKDKVKTEHSSEHKKPKEGKERDKHKESKEKIKHDGSKDKHHDKPKDKLKEKHGEKPKDKHKDKSEKHKDKSEKSLDKSVDPVKIKIDKSSLEKKEFKEHKKTDEGFKTTISIKQEPSSPIKHKKTDDSFKSSISIKQEPSSPIKHKESDDSFRSSISIKRESISPDKDKEDTLSEDDVPLAIRKAAQPKPKPAKKKYAEESSEDDEPISKRFSKAKKLKTEESSKKRKAVEDDDYNDYKPVKKVKKVEKGGKPKKEPANETASPKKRGKKEEEQEVWKWWEEEKQEEGVKWKTLQHNGPVFAPLYERVPKSVKFYYDGKHMELSEQTEEVAGFYGRMLDHEYTSKDSFNSNFFKDWRKVMTSGEKEIIKDLKKCNFNAFNEYYKEQSEIRKGMSKEEKAVIKKQNEELTQKFGFCIVDGHKQKIGNFKIEPPGLFRGRGEHPKMGMLKRRVQPEDVTINIGKEAKVPDPPAGHKWKKVHHDNKVTWLASWNENILNSTKYIMLNPSSKLKGEKDWQKYETARKLKNYADQIRETYSSDFKSKEMRVRQRAVALYFIDKLALRAGNEKDEDTADTVGCCSLRVEHITLDEEKDGQEYVVSFDFLGKDCIRYVNSVAVEKRAFKNLKLFMENKQPGDDLFDRLNTTILNKYLNELMEGLTAKVFRTYNASKTLQEQLDLLTQEEMSIPEKMLAYNRANRAVAVLCNHQRAVPKTFSKSMESLKGKIDDKLAQIKEVKRELKQAKSDSKNSSSVKDKTMVEKKKKRLKQLEDQLKKLEVQATDKEENKQIALGTSKLNYLDPRISVAWCKKWDVPIEKIYNRTQRDKFRWAIEMAGPDFVF